MSYSYTFPGNIRFGEGAFRELPECLPADSHPLLVMGKSFSLSAEGKQLLELLSPFHPVIRIGIPAEPPLECVDELITLGRTEQVDSVIAVGGGSVIDAAKAAAALIPAEGFVKEYFSGERNIPGKGLFFAALPTTAGTGAESTNNSVLTDVSTKIKKSLRHPSMKADLAIVDPMLTWSCPRDLTAASGLDAFVQAFEGYTNPKSSELTRALSAQAVKLILKNLEGACAGDHAARYAMAEGSMLSGVAFSQTGLGAVHGFAHPVGSLLHVPHGVACAILMVRVMRWNEPVCGDRYRELAEICGVPDFTAAAEQLAQRVGIPADFKQYGLKKEHIPFIVKNCRSASMSTNPRPFTDEEAEVFLEAFY